MDCYELPFVEFPKRRPWRFNLVENVDDLNRRIAREAVDAIKAAGRSGRHVLIVTPVGPLDYSYWATLCNEEGVSCEPLTTLAMDAYLDDRSDDYVDLRHPLSFRRFIFETFVNRLLARLRPDPANVCFPDPREPARTTALVEWHGGADLCFGGCGITGHFAFNDPPESGESCDDVWVRGSRTRCVTIARESQAQMCMGGTNGNWDAVPRRAVTLGMHELLMSKKIHLTFMRSWHAGVLRRVLFGPMSGRCPGSFLQQHPNVEVTLTRLAATVPVINVAQAIGEES